MPKLNGRVPRYRRHKRSGQAIVTLNGRDHYLGPHGSQTSVSEYDRLVAEWLASGRRLEQAEANAAKSDADLVRYEQLVRKQNISRQQYDQAVAAAKANRAAVVAA